MTWWNSDDENITINIGDYIGMQAFLALEKISRDLDIAGNQTWTMILYAYQDYCYLWGVLYESLFNMINRLWDLAIIM